MTTTLEKRPMAKTFYCVSCQSNRPIEPLGKIAQRSFSKRFTFCCDKADAQRARLAKGIVA